MKRITFFAYLAALFIISSPPSFGAERKLIIFYTPGPKGISAQVLDAISRHPRIKLAVEWQPALPPSDATAALARTGQIEPVPAMENEPILPLIYELNISSPFDVRFSRPEDISQMIFFAQQSYKNRWGAENTGLFLESGALSYKLFGEFKKMNVSWAASAVQGPGDGVFKADGIVFFLCRKYDFDNFDKFWDWVLSEKQQKSSAVWISKPALLTPEFVTELSVKLGEITGRDTELSLPSAVVLKDSSAVSAIQPSEIDSDLQPWLKIPAVWRRLQQARQDIEEYKNSGQAKIKTLEAAKDEIFNLYGFDLIRKLNDNPGGEQGERFVAGLSNIYRLIKKSMPPEMSEPLMQPATLEEEQQFQLVSSSSGALFYNSANLRGSGSISSFSITFSTKSVVYEVFLSTQSSVPNPVIDIYIDLNNIRGAGLTRFLPGAVAYMKPDDAWEFALRMDNNDLYLYRSGQITPSIIRKERLKKRYQAEIPRALLRGDPLKWGYQAVLYSRKSELAPPVIEDFLCPENIRREKLIQKNPVELPALRIGR